MLQINIDRLVGELSDFCERRYGTDIRIHYHNMELTQFSFIHGPYNWWLDLRCSVSMSGRAWHVHVFSNRIDWDGVARPYNQAHAFADAACVNEYFQQIRVIIEDLHEKFLVAKACDALEYAAVGHNA